VPIMHTALPAAFIAYGAELVELLREFPDDFGFYLEGKIPTSEELHPTYRLGRHTDEWGCVWENEQEGLLGICVGHPLADWSNWSSFKFPEIPSLEDVIKTQNRGESDLYVFGFGFNLFERMQFLRGYEALMFDLALKTNEAYMLRDALVEWSVEYARRSAEANIDGMPYADDWGTQLSLIISPAAWREFFKPAYARMFEPAKSKGKHVHFHSDGYTIEIIPDLIDVGVDVLNVQHAIMDIKQLGREFGGRVAFRSDLDRQHILPHGSRQQIRDHVKEVIDCLGSFDGGLIGHGEIAPDVPLENIRYALEAWRDFGNY